MVDDFPKKLAISAAGNTTPSSATTSHPETVIMMNDANLSSRKSSEASKDQANRTTKRSQSH